MASLSELGFSTFPSFSVRPRARAFPMAQSSSICVVNCCLGKSTKILKQQNPILFAATPRKNRKFMSHRSLELEQFVASDDEDEMGDGFFEAIEEIESMTREPSDVLEEMNHQLSARELQLVLVYFSQEGNSWCALEVFEWLKKENRVDKETMELMVAIMCGWMRKLIEGGHEVNGVADLLVDMDCVGLKPSFSMFEKVISLYWESKKKKKKAGSFVKEVLRRGTVNSEGDDEGHKGGPT